MELEDRLKAVAGSMLLMLALGTFGYAHIEGWGYFDALYMTVITLGTIGYGEVHPLSPAGRAFTIAFCMVGLGVAAYAFSTVTALVVEGQLSTALRRRRMEARIQKLERHYIVCGAGFTGESVIDELKKTGRPFVVVERNKEKVQRYTDEGVLAVEGDALQDETLERAGARRARGLFCALDSDPDNVFLAISARGLSATLRIVSEVHDADIRGKLLRSGADAVVSSQGIGGLRMASEMIRPAAVGFLDWMIREQKSAYRIEEIPVPEGSPLVGQPLRAVFSREGRAPLVLAIKDADKADYVINPSAADALRARETLVVLGSREDVERLRASVGA